jgi:hypothetical protein
MDHHDDDDDDDCMNSAELSVDDSFIAVLHAIVSDESLDSAIHWMPCGKMFIVANREEFVRLVLLQNNFGSRRGTSSSLSSFDMSRTGTFVVPTKMYQDEVVPQEGQGRSKKRLSLGSRSDKFELFGMNQVYASTGNITNSKSLASIVTAESTGGGGFKDNYQFPIFGMNSTSSAVTSTATNFTPSSVDSLMTLYKPHCQKQTWGCELCEEQPLQNVADCCDSDGEDSIDAFFKDFKCTDPLNGNLSNSLCLFTTADQAGKFGEL